MTQLTPSASNSPIRILIVEDEETLRESCASVLEHDGYAVTISGVAREAENLLRHKAFDVLLLDWYMSDIPGWKLVPVALASNPLPRTIAVRGKATLASSLEALRVGVWAYLAKPFSAVQLAIVVGQAAHATLSARESLRRSQALEQAGENSDKIRILGLAPAFRGAISRARKVAPTYASVLLTGESGSGKELFAQFIHHHSRRASRPFLAVNCAALPEPLLESEMFGHRRGAFTGAVRDKPGLLDRVEDIELLANSFLGHYWRKYRGIDLAVPRLGKGAMAALKSHPWPGNVRELQNVIEHAVVLLEPAAEISAADIPFLSIPAPASDRRLGLEHTAGTGADDSYYDARDRSEERRV